MYANNLYMCIGDIYNSKTLTYELSFIGQGNDDPTQFSGESILNYINKNLYANITMGVVHGMIILLCNKTMVLEDMLVQKY